MKKIRGVLLLYAVLYMFMFLLVPRLCPLVYHSGNERLFIFVSLTIVYILMAMLAYSDRLLDHLLGLILYACLMLIYTEPGAYGIGMVGLNLDGMSQFFEYSGRYFHILIWLFLTLVLQLAVWLAVKAYRKLRPKGS